MVDHGRGFIGSKILTPDSESTGPITPIGGLIGLKNSAHGDFEGVGSYDSPGNRSTIYSPGKPRVDTLLANPNMIAF